MDLFFDELRQAYELWPIPFASDELIDGKAIPLLVSDIFC